MDGERRVDSVDIYKLYEVTAHNGILLNCELSIM